MGTIKDRNAKNLTEAEDIKKKWQEYTEELYKTDLHDPDNHNSVITHLEQDILECKVKWALGSITMNKASGGDGIPVELFQIPKDDSRSWKQNGGTDQEDKRNVWQGFSRQEYWSGLPFPSPGDLPDPDNHNGVITHLEPDILECKINWALGSITMNKASGGNGILVISNPKRWCCESAALSMPANWKNSAVATGLEKVSFHSKAKEGSNCCTTALISLAK